jgi:hypothetical protein
MSIVEHGMQLGRGESANIPAGSQGLTTWHRGNPGNPKVWSVYFED